MIAAFSCVVLQSYFFQKGTIDLFELFQKAGSNLNKRVVSLNSQNLINAESLVRSNTLLEESIETRVENLGKTFNAMEDIRNLALQNATDTAVLISAVEELQISNNRNVECLKLAFKILEASDLLPPGLINEGDTISENFIPFTGQGYSLRESIGEE